MEGADGRRADRVVGGLRAVAKKVGPTKFFFGARSSAG